MFCTGTDIEPPAGFEGIPRIEFTDEDRLPEANTCIFRLTLSRKYVAYDMFKEKMDFAIQNTFGFGKI